MEGSILLSELRENPTGEIRQALTLENEETPIRRKVQDATRRVVVISVWPISRKLPDSWRQLLPLLVYDNSQLVGSFKFMEIEYIKWFLRKATKRCDILKLSATSLSAVRNLQIMATTFKYTIPSSQIQEGTRTHPQLRMRVC